MRFVFEPYGSWVTPQLLSQKYKAFSLLSDATRAAALLEREELLTAESRYLTSASYRRRAETEGELAEIHRRLEALGFKHPN